MSQRPSEKPDWIPDDATGISAPNGAKRAAGWLIEKPPLQYFNWFWNIISQWMDFFGGQSQGWIVIDSDADEQDYATLAAYIADAPAAGDKLLIKEDQTVTIQTVIPSDITMKFLDGAQLLCATNIATSVLQLGSDIIIEGVLNIVLSQTGTTAKAVEYNGDNVTGQINVENASTGTLTTAHHINAAKNLNYVTGSVQNTGGGVLTNSVVNNSATATNLLLIRDSASGGIVGGLADATQNGLMASSDFSKLAGVEPGADVNNISDVNATDLTDGGETTLHSHAAGVGMGAWATKVFATIYLAATDGFVVADAALSAGSLNLIGITDSAATPVTVRQQVASSTADANNARGAITFPVKKGDYYQVTTTGTGLNYFFMPIGS